MFRRTFVILLVLLMVSVGPATVLLPTGASIGDDGTDSRAGPDVWPEEVRVNETDPVWFGYCVGTVGVTTDIEADVRNLGDTNATDVDVRIEVRDFFWNLMDLFETTIDDVPPGEIVTVVWPDWTPAHSAEVSVRVELALASDADTSNDNRTFYAGWVTRWLDMAGEQLDWSGNIAPGQWHVTDSVETDPSPGAHSGPYVWYAGTEGPILADHYDPGMNASLVSRSVDLRRMNPYYPAFLNFKYYGWTLPEAPEDHLGLAVSIDNGATWIDTTTRISGATITNGTPAWRVRVDNWIDLDNDGIMDPGEYNYGIDISEYIGHVVKFRFTFVSGPASTGLGYYLDDFIVYGYEAENEIALVTIGDIGTTHLNETEDVVATFANLGLDQSPTLQARMTVYEGSTKLWVGNETVPPIDAGASADVTWSYTPEETGDLKLEVELLSPPSGEDSSFFNNRQTRRMHVSSGTAGVLLVDDDAGRSNSGRLHMRDYEVDTDYMMVSAIDEEIDVLHVLYNEQGPGLDVLQDYHTVIWSTGWDGNGRTIYGTLGPDDRANLRAFLDGGGSLWMMSQEVAFDLEDDDPDFMSDYLHISGYGDDDGTPDVIYGVVDNVITDGLVLDARVVVPGNDRADSIEPDGEAEGILYQDPNGQNPAYNGIGFNGTYKMVYSSFEPSAITQASDRALLADRVLDWLFSGLSMEIRDHVRTVASGDTTNYTVVVRNHGSTNKTVEELKVVSVSPGWEAEMEPKVQGGVPETVLQGFETLTAGLMVRTPDQYPPGSEGHTRVRLTVAETGEVFENTTRTIIQETVKLNITISPREQVGESGRNASYLVTVTNIGNVKVSVNMSLNGTIDTWASLDTAFLVLEAGEHKGVVVTLSVPRTALAGNYTMDVIAEGNYGTMFGKARGSLNITVKQQSRLGISNVKVPNGGKVDPAKPDIQITVEIDNKGNGDDLVNVSLSGSFPDEEMWNWSAIDVLVPAFAKGHKVILPLTIWEEAPGMAFNITITAASQDGKTVADGHVLITVLRPDLYLTEEGIVFDYDLVVGAETSFKVRIFNGGEVDSPPPEITIYDRGGELLFSKALISDVKSGGFAELNIDWTPQYKGQEELNIYVNELKDLVEMSYENNSVVVAIEVFQPNLKVEAADVTYHVGVEKKQRVKEGDMVTILAEIKNMDPNSYKAKDVVVEFYLDGTLIGNKTIDVDAQNNAFVKVEWKAVKGQHTVTVKVDPQDRIIEAKEDDNEVTKDLFVDEPGKAGLQLDPMMIGIVVVVAIIVVLAYAMARGAIPSPVRKSQVEIADQNYKCNECGKRIKKGREHYHCACGRRSHVKCAKKAELCECLKRVRIEG